MHITKHFEFPHFHFIFSLYLFTWPTCQETPVNRQDNSVAALTPPGKDDSRANGASSSRPALASPEPEADRDGDPAELTERGQLRLGTEGRKDIQNELYPARLMIWSWLDFMHFIHVVYKGVILLLVHAHALIFNVYTGISFYACDF